MSSQREDSKAAFAWEIFKFAAGIGLTCYFASKTLSMLNASLDTGKQNPTQAIASKKLLAKRLKRPEVETMEFGAYELRLMTDVLGADEIDVSFEDIGGLETQLEEIKDNIVLPIQLFHHARTMSDLRDLTTCPTGVLLYGRPGTGKSLMAKAIAKETGCTFLNIKASSLTDKWFGESDHLVSALFSLARKLGPSVVFIDEIETLLKKRGVDQANPALQSMQGVFLSEWDGLGALNNACVQVGAHPIAPVIVMGATNRPGDLDAAFLRRMPVHIKTEMPDAKARLSILKAQLKKETLGEDVDLEVFAAMTEGYSGSDLREFVRVACLQRAKDVTAACREALLTTKANTSLNSAANKSESIKLQNSSLGAMRPLNANDFQFAISKTQKTVNTAGAYKEEVFKEDFEEKFKTTLKLHEVLSKK